MNYIEHGLKQLEKLLAEHPPAGATPQETASLTTRRVFFAGAWLVHRLHVGAQAQQQPAMRLALVQELARELHEFEATLADDTPPGPAAPTPTPTPTTRQEATP